MNKLLVKTGLLILLSAPVNALPAESAPDNTAAGMPSIQSDVAVIKKWLAKSQQHVIPAPLPAESPAPGTVAMISETPLVESPPISYAQSQQTMLKSLPNAETDVNSNMSSETRQAFDAMVQQNIPLTPHQVVKLRQLIDQSQRAAVIPPTVPPKPVSSTIMVNLAPGTTPPAIRLAQGYVTSLVFVDSAGSPWPIASYDMGNAKATNIQWDGKGNILLIQATMPYGDSDVVIRLVGLATPVTLELVSGQRVVDYRTDIHVPGFGPNSKNLPVGTGVPQAANPTLLSVLDGVAPAGSIPLSIRGGGDCLAWGLGDRMYLRTRMTVLSPGWTGRMASPDGMFAYEMSASSSVLISRHGEPVELKVEGF